MPLSMELLRLTPLDGWTLEEACLGNLITGGTGSGKASGPFQYTIRSFSAPFAAAFFFAPKRRDEGLSQDDRERQPLILNPSGFVQADW